MTAALEAAECGKQVVLIEKAPTLGGRVSQLYKYFPKLCYPTCGLEINLRRIKANRNIHLLTMAEVEQVSGVPGDFSVAVRVHPRYVTESCTACGDCAKAVTTEFDDEFNYGINRRKSAYLPYNLAYPQRYVLDGRVIGTPDAEAAKAACKVNAIDLEMRDEVITLKAGAIVWATGWKPYDAALIQPYGYDRFANVITNMEFERMLDPFGPTGGKIQRPSDGAAPKSIAFIQCAGSRDHNYLKHCSRVCCMATLKQTTYVRENLGDSAKSSVYYIDIRAIDRIDDFHRRVKDDPNVTFIKSKVASITQDQATGDVFLHGNDLEKPGLGGDMRYKNRHDLVVLAVGMSPSVPAEVIPAQVSANPHGFIELDLGKGIFGAGVSSEALDVNRAVQNATAAALRAIQVVNRVAGVEG
jgi:quinone-modifying oxidoreductase subunit QmoA